MEWWLREESRSKGALEQQTQRRSGRNSQIHSPLPGGYSSDLMIAGKEDSSDIVPLIVMTDSEKMITKLQIELT